MKTAAYIAVVAAAIPSVWSLPAGLSSRQFKVPACGAEACLASTGGNFVTNGTSNGTAPSDLGGICSLSQADVNQYVRTVQPCIDGDAGKKACTGGAIDRKSTIDAALVESRALTETRVQGSSEVRVRKTCLRQHHSLVDLKTSLLPVQRLTSISRFTIPRSFSIKPEFGHNLCAFPHETITHRREHAQRIYIIDNEYTPSRSQIYSRHACSAHSVNSIISYLSAIDVILLTPVE